MGIADRLRNLDTHSSVSSEFRVYTLHGAVLSLITVIAITYLVFTEVVYNFQTTLLERVHVNSTSPAGIEMEFDITLNNVPCSRLSIDANDPNGQTQSLHLDRNHHVWKHRIKIIDEQYKDREDDEEPLPSSEESHSRGRVLLKRKSPNTRILFLGDKTKIELGSTLLSEEHLEDELQQFVTVVDEDDDDKKNKSGTKNDEGDGDDEEEEASKKSKEEECGSCYGAGEEGECCNTCDDVKRAYNRKSWILRDLHNVDQCKGEDSKNVKVSDDEGCNIHGVVALSSGGGNLHLAPGRGLSDGTTAGEDSSEGRSSVARALGGEEDSDKEEPMSLVDLVLQAFEQWNVSHSINKIRFGQEFPGHVHQLDDEVRVIEDTYGMYQYYFQIVPTLYKFLNGTTIQTNQYSVTEHLRHVNPGSGRGLPGVFFFYEVSPLHVEISEVYRKGYIAFFTSVCAIVGGVVSVMGMIDQLFFTRLFKSRSIYGETLAR